MLIIMMWLIIVYYVNLCFVKHCCFLVVINVDDDFGDDDFVDYDLLIVWMKIHDNANGEYNEE